MNLGLDSEPLVWYYIDTGRSANAQSTGKERKKNMAIDFKNLLTVLPLVTDAGHPVLLRGRHGIGKSSVVYQYAESLGMPIVERRASQMTEGDLLGLPTVDEGVTSFCPPDWFATACDNGVVLFSMRLTVQRSKSDRVSSSFVILASSPATLSTRIL